MPKGAGGRPNGEIVARTLGITLTVSIVCKPVRAVNANIAGTRTHDLTYVISLVQLNVLDCSVVYLPGTFISS